MNNDGWGWNYVQCLESIVWNQRFDSETDCWKLTSLCRDVTQTNGMDEFGNDLRGSDRTISGSFADPPASAIIVAILAGAFASAMIYRAVRGGFSITATPKDAARGDEYGNVEFTVIQ